VWCQKQLGDFRLPCCQKSPIPHNSKVTHRARTGVCAQEEQGLVLASSHPGGFLQDAVSGMLIWNHVHKKTFLGRKRKKMKYDPIVWPVPCTVKE
jgi:hypothetical protein